MPTTLDDPGQGFQIHIQHKIYHIQKKNFQIKL